ncbi:MAG: hypothetical protein AB7E60_04615 [Sphingobium sp.]
MGKIRWITGSLIGLALLSSAITAAEARPRYGHGGWGHHHHRDRGNGFGFGDAVGVAALIGAAAIVATSLSKDRKAARADDAPPPGGTDYGADVQDDGWRDGHRGDRADEDGFADVSATREGEDRMTDACALAARDEAAARGGYAEVRHIDAPRATGDGGHNIDGTIETRSTVRANDGMVRRFTCSMRDGRVATIYMSRDAAMR